MEAREIEQRLRDMDYLRVIVPALEEQLARLKSSATGSRVECKDGTPGAPSQADKLGSEVAHIVHIEQLLRERRPELDVLDAWARPVIMCLDKREQDVMRLRHIDGMTMQQVAEALHYSMRYCYDVRTAAIKQMSKRRD